MNKSLQEWKALLGSAFPSGANAYWRALPVGRMKSLLVGTFFISAVVGFAADLLQLNSQSLGRGFFWPALFGSAAVGILVAKIKRVRPIFLAVFVFVSTCTTIWVAAGLSGLGWSGLHWLTDSISLVFSLWPIPQAMKARLFLDSIGVWICGVLGFRLLLSFVTNEGLSNVRMQTELSLAHGIQARLVPDITLQTSRFEVYGRSIPGTEMGGDLIDLIESDDGGLLAYVADISGHGLAAGQLMGMLKAALPDHRNDRARWPETRDLELLVA